MPTSANVPQPPPTGQYTIDASKSTVTFVTKHMFGLGKVRGRLAVTRGSIVIAEISEDSSVDVEISAKSFSTRNPLRDVQVRSLLLLSTRRHPAISFRASGVRRRGNVWTVRGTLTVKGRSAPVEIILTSVEGSGGSPVFTGQAEVDRYALGVTMMRGMAARHLSVDITAHATKA